jgi:CHAT domain-containing protein
MEQSMRRARREVWWLVTALLLCTPCAAQQNAGPASSPADGIAKAREALKAAEAAHPGDTPEVAAAINDLVSLQIDAGLADQDTLALIDRTVKIAEVTAGARSKAYVIALVTRMDVLTGLNRAPEAREVAEKAFEIAQKEFPDSSETAVAAGALGRICSKLGDFPCAVRAHEFGVELDRRTTGNNTPELAAALNNLGAMESRAGDVQGAIKAEEEALAISYRLAPDDNHIGVIENNLGSNYLKVQNFSKAAEHLNRAADTLGKLYGPDSTRLMWVNRNLAALFTRTGQFALAWKAYEFSLQSKYEQMDNNATNHAQFAQSLAQGGNAQRAVEEGLTSARISREIFVLQARTLPERQALAYDATRPHGLDTSISVVLKHPELQTAEIYQELIRSRALVADEMARRQRNLNSNNDPETARLLGELNQARRELLAAENSTPDKTARADKMNAASGRMEKIERELAQRSATARNDERIDLVTTESVRHNLPAHSVLISYVEFRRRVIDAVDPAAAETPSYMAFVLHPESDRIQAFDLGESKGIADSVTKARSAADAEAHGGGMGSTRNERAYREAALGLRKRIWDPLQAAVGDARLALIVPDGVLNLVPFSALPSGKGYLIEHGPVIHVLTSERDLVPGEGGTRKTGLLAVGSPQFELAAVAGDASRMRDASVPCEDFRNLQFHPLPGTGAEVADIGKSWRRWNGAEPSALLTGAEATRNRFIEQASQNRVLHVATHAFVLDRSCGNGNPLLHSGLVFAGANASRDAAILTAQQIASLDLSGVDWAVLSACNTGAGELHDGEGVLGLQRAFRVAGARSVIMTLWPVDDDVTRQFMHELYTQRLGRHASTADAMWNSSRKLLMDRRAAGKSTHPWYWAGFVGSGGWE